MYNFRIVENHLMIRLKPNFKMKREEVLQLMNIPITTIIFFIKKI